MNRADLLCPLSEKSCQNTLFRLGNILLVILLNMRLNLLNHSRSLEKLSLKSINLKRGILNSKDFIERLEVQTSLKKNCLATKVNHLSSKERNSCKFMLTDFAIPVRVNFYVSLAK